MPKLVNYSTLKKLMKPTITKIGFFGGTFDPIHIGHLIVADSIRYNMGLDKVIFVPAKVHPLKDNTQITPAEHRYKMVSLAINDHPGFEVSDYEMKKADVSYTVETMRHFKTVYPDAQFQRYLLIGSDVVNEFHKWHQPEEIVKLCDIIAFYRAGAKPEPQSKLVRNFQFSEVPQLYISATEIRHRIRNGMPFRYFVTDAVRAYILDNRLYVK